MPESVDVKKLNSYILALVFVCLAGCTSNKGPLKSPNTTQQDPTDFPTPSLTPTTTAIAPSVVAVLGPTPGKISSQANATHNAVVEVTCSQSGSARVLSSGGQVITDWTPVTQGTSAALNIEGAAVDAATAADGSHGLKIICKNSGGLESVAHTGASIELDSTAPVALLDFTGQTGNGVEGAIDLTLEMPNSTADYSKIKIRQLLGAVAPNADCSTDGQFVLTRVGPFTDLSLTLNTGAPSGEHYSYRVCIYDSVGNLQSSDTLTDIPSKDTRPPESLISFQADQGSSAGRVLLSWEYPLFVTDYESMQIRRVAGDIPPPNSCAAGTIVTTFNRPINVNLKSFEDNTGGTSNVSYRFCIRDSTGNLNNWHTLSAVSPKQNPNQNILEQFVGRTGTVNHEVLIAVTHPSPRGYDKLEIRSLAGATAPSNACNTGTIEKTITSFTNGDVSIIRPDTSKVSFRACLKLGTTLVGTSNVTTNIQPKDLDAPPLLALTGNPGINAREISLQIDFPAVTTDFNRVEIFEQMGNETSAPVPTCSGTPIATLTGSQLQDSTLTFPGRIETKTYSYRACSYDAFGNGSWENIAVNVRPRSSGGYLSEMLYFDKVAAIESAYQYWKAGVRDGFSPLRIFEFDTLQAGDRIRITYSYGVSIARIHNGQIDPNYPPMPCPNGWLLHFVNPSSPVTLYDEVSHDLNGMFATDVVVPANGVQAYIGFQDSAYFDNEGKRSTSNGSTGGCDFTFQLRR